MTDSLYITFERPLSRTAAAELADQVAADLLGAPAPRTLAVVDVRGEVMIEPFLPGHGPLGAVLAAPKHRADARGRLSELLKQFGRLSDPGVMMLSEHEHRPPIERVATFEAVLAQAHEPHTHWRIAPKRCRYSAAGLNLRSFRERGARFTADAAVVADTEGEAKACLVETLGQRGFTPLDAIRFTVSEAFVADPCGLEFVRITSVP